MTTHPADRHAPVRLGTRERGEIARLRDGVLDVTDGPARGRRIEVWIHTERGWHRPATSASTHVRLLDDTPVVATHVRVSGGEVVITCAATLADASPGSDVPDAGDDTGSNDRTGVHVEVHNRTPSPVGVAWVVRCPRTVGAATDRSAEGVVPLGIGWSIRLSRPPRSTLVAGDVKTLSEGLTALSDDVARDQAEPPGNTGAEEVCTAMVVPLPHTATTTAWIGPGRPTPGVNADAIVTGWSRHRDTTPAVETGSDQVDARWRRSIADLLLAGAGQRSPLTDRALARIGANEATDGLVAMAGGAPVATSTTAAIERLHLIVTAWESGLDADAATVLAAHVGVQVRWLAARRRRKALGTVADAPVVLARLAAMMDDLGLDRAARQIAGLGTTIRSEPNVHGFTPTPNGSAFDDLARRPMADELLPASVDASAATVLSIADALARPEGDSVAVATARWLCEPGRNFEVARFGTRWGALSYAMRWHGERPALLWELLPWSGRVPAGRFVLTAPAIDRTWSNSDLHGEALLNVTTPVPSS
ncbi:MAG: hypothetical protein R2698_11945 [Microthrixaceae bacterium]